MAGLPSDFSGLPKNTRKRSPRADKYGRHRAKLFIEDPRKSNPCNRPGLLDKSQIPTEVYQLQKLKKNTPHQLVSEPGSTDLGSWGLCYSAKNSPVPSLGLRA